MTRALWIVGAALFALAAGCRDDGGKAETIAASGGSSGGSGGGGGMAGNGTVAAASPILGLEGDDALGGTDGDDAIAAGGGNDTLVGGPGRDLIDGGAGDDILLGDGEIPDPHPEGRGWALVWSDEFDGTTLDPEKWAPEVSCWGGGNNERQCYTGRQENVRVENGVLRLIARVEAFTGPTNPPEWNAPDPQNTQPYTSGKVRTRGLADWTYGRFEVRARPPQGQGLWPAIWMMPIGDHYGGWPLSGEIDIMEAVNLGTLCTDCGGAGEYHTSSAIHFGDQSPANQYRDHETVLAGGAQPADAFHVYAVEWGEGLLQFFVDDQLHFTVDSDEWYTVAENAEGNPNAPFDRPFYIMANLAVGGQWPENANALGIDDTALPADFLIDYVRIYQCAKDTETGRACMDDR